ncbi:putative glycosyltransferase [Bacillus sp. TS-2]|nr:putative glycosyltransferase [Bacillus sp. TS-2]
MVTDILSSSPSESPLLPVSELESSLHAANATTKAKTKNGPPKYRDKFAFTLQFPLNNHLFSSEDNQIMFGRYH